MLDINKISHAPAYEKEWKKQRLGKITGSLVFRLMSKNSDKGQFTQTAITYLQGLAGEAITGVPAKEEFFNDATDFGNAHEIDAIERFCVLKNLIPLRTEEGNDTHRLIINDEYTGVTPDALIPVNPHRPFNEAGTHLNIYTLEVKAPPTHHRFIKLYECTTPEELKIANDEYYWQVISQNVWCDVLKSFFMAYSPIFHKERIIEFNKLQLRDDIKFFNNTIEHAKKILIKYINLLK